MDDAGLDDVALDDAALDDAICAGNEAHAAPVPPRLRIKLQVYCGAEIAMGPGKADLLEAIVRTGSISGAAKALGMSYRRAWMLVDTMNRCWQGPLVTTAPGGTAHGGGARVTPLGVSIGEGYRALQRRAGLADESAAWSDMSAALLGAPRASQHE